MPNLHIRTLVLSLVALVQISGCSKWPPFEDELRENLLENQQTFEQLESIISETDFTFIRIHGPGSTVSVGRLVDGEVAPGYVDNKEEWRELLYKAKVRGISREGDAFAYLVSNVDRGGSTIYFEYVHNANSDDYLKVCLPEHQKVGCGKCKVEMYRGWWVHYRWIPDELIDEETVHALYDGKITQEEYDRTLESAITQCWRDGYAKMDYPLND